MKIGILTYHSVPNFGANLQALSTVEYLRKQGYDPIIINWRLKELEENYQKQCSEKQLYVFKEFQNTFLPLTKVCETEIEVAQTMELENIDALIIGSDAIAQCHSFIRRTITRTHYTHDRYYPNIFWGTFVKYLKRNIPIAIMSASSQDSDYKWITNRDKKTMSEFLSQCSYVSARDIWTQKTYRYITNKSRKPEITPDPVFAFNYNVENQLNKEYILRKFNLSEKYILISFLNEFPNCTDWVDEFNNLAKSNNYDCVPFPVPQGICFKSSLQKKIESPINPMEWYALIKYSCGYIGHNMHPIVVALHNSVPFFSFDNYGSIKFHFFTNEKTSKIYHILSNVGFLENRFFCTGWNIKYPSVNNVWNKIIQFDKEKSCRFSNSYLEMYKKMMENIIESFETL